MAMALTISNGKLSIYVYTICMYVYMVYIYKIWDQYETYLGALLGNAQLSLRQATPIKDPSKTMRR